VEIVGYLIPTRGIASPLIKYDRKRLRVIKVHNTPYSGGKIKLFAPSHKILWHVKDLCEYERNIL
jgi:hypothetical protein